MTRRSKLWLGAAVVFVVVNLAGAVLAAMAGELLHCAAHVALLVPGTWLTARLYRRGQGTGEGIDANAAAPEEFTDRLRNLEQSVDAVAIEIERIGEGQRFMTRVMSDRAADPLPVEDARPAASELAEPIPRSPHGAAS